MIYVLDVENSTTVIEKEGRPDKLDMTPFRSSNQLVSVGVKAVDTGDIIYEFLNHSELKHSNVDGYARLELCMNTATLIIGHNLKHDLNWMRACNFTVPKGCEFWDTSIAEYVLAKGMVHKGFSLAGIAERRKLPLKKSELVESYFAEGKTMYDIPMSTIEEYGRGDLDTTEALYKDQLERLSQPHNKGLLPTIKMMNEFMWVLAKWTYTGIKIDLKALAEVETEYRAEQVALLHKLTTTAKEYMGDTPFNLNSQEDRSVIIYSRKVKDKNKWAETFNIGVDARGKKLKRPRMLNTEFVDKVRELTNVEYRTVAEQCIECSGEGYYTPPLKSGLPGKARRICKTCQRVGVVYVPTKRIAGFKISPGSTKSCAVNGFSTDADTLEALVEKCTLQDGKEFLQGLVRLNQINTYLNTFVEGIKAATIPETGILYTNFNQIVTATGRLSSSNPNFQNIPRGTTFPAKKAIVSRFQGGKILEVDFAQLEFRCAGELSNCPQIFKDVLAGVDVHSFSRDTLNLADGGSRDRQSAKSETFKPIYGGTYGSPAQMAYYAAFKQKYHGHTAWTEKIGNQVLKYGTYTSLTGRQYSWVGVKREWDGRPTYFTQIVNYPVQGFATADIVPIACINVQSALESGGYKSVAFLTVHDSIAVDCSPDELDVIPNLVVDAMLAARESLKERYGYTMKMPLEVEAKMGYNMYDMEKVMKKGNTDMINDFFDDSLEGLGA